MTNAQSRMTSRKTFRYEPAPRNLSVKQLKRKVMRDIIRNATMTRMSAESFANPSNDISREEFLIRFNNGNTIGVNGGRDCGAFAQKTYTGLVGEAMKKLGVGNEQKGVEGLKKIMDGTRYIQAFCYSLGLPEYKYENGGRGREITMWIVMDGGKVIAGQTGEMWVSDFKTFCIKNRCFGIVDFTNSLGLEVKKTKEGLQMTYEYPAHDNKTAKKHGGVLAEMLMEGQQYTERGFVSYELVGEIRGAEVIAKYASIAEEFALKPDPTMVEVWADELVAEQRSTGTLNVAGAINWDIIRISEAYLRRQPDYVEGEEIVYQGTGAM